MNPCSLQRPGKGGSKEDVHPSEMVCVPQNLTFGLQIVQVSMKSICDTKRGNSNTRYVFQIPTPGGCLRSAGLTQYASSGSVGNLARAHSVFQPAVVLSVLVLATLDNAGSQPAVPTRRMHIGTIRQQALRRELPGLGT